MAATAHEPRRLQLANSDLSHERNVALGALALDNIGGRVKWRILDGLVKDRVGHRCVDELGLEQRICVGAWHSFAARVTLKYYLIVRRYIFHIKGLAFSAKIHGAINVIVCILLL